jgi:lipoprotein NlpI
MRVPALALLLLLSAIRVAAAQSADTPRAILDRATADFARGAVEQAAAGFDEVARLVPAAAPQLWQRGIVLYYVGRYADCRAQFESHRTVNPNDVENAAWHFLCVARAESPAAARAALLPVGPDARPIMRQVYDLFRGVLTPEAVLTSAGGSLSGRFYAHLYLGLYFEAMGDAPRAREHITQAAADQYAPAGYMHTVARVHLARLAAPR